MPTDYIYLKETSSTQTHLKSLDVNALPEFYCVRAGFQQQGRGRGSNGWESLPDENLMMSVLLFPDTSPEKQFDISCMTALALVETLQQNTNIQNIKIKWPNDIYIQDKKIAGILIEHTLSVHQIKHSIIGIGLNVNQKQFSETIPNPTSIFLETKQTYAVEQLCFDVIEHLKKWKRTDRQTLLDKYNHLLYRKKKFCQYIIKQNNTSIWAKIVGIDNFGRLLLQDNAQNMMKFELNEISYII